MRNNIKSTYEARKNRLIKKLFIIQKQSIKFKKERKKLKEKIKEIEIDLML